MSDGELALRGRLVCVLERSAVLGGCIRTDEITRPSFKGAIGRPVALAITSLPLSGESAILQSAILQ